MIRRQVLASALLVAVLLGMVTARLSLAAPNPSRSMQEGGNLLINPGFEDQFGAWNPDDCPSCYWGKESCGDNICMTAHVCAWWIPFWENCAPDDSDCSLRMPEYKPAAPFADRIRTGGNAQQLFTNFAPHIGGVFQTVGNLQPGARVALSAYAQGWSSNDGDVESDHPLDNMVFRVGIDPDGGTDPWASSIVWSPLKPSPDAYRLIGPVEAQVGAEGKVTVFLYSTVQHYPFQDNNAYFDDVSLVYKAPPATPTSTPLPTATPGPPPTPLPTPTPRPDGSIVHVVEKGDTLSSIAYRYDVPMGQIRELNAGSIGANDLIRVGQELVISVPKETPTPPSAPASATPSSKPSPAASATPEGASICVLAFHDRNEDTFRDEENEELLPNAEFTVADASGVIDKYTTDGIGEPHCFTGLSAGDYRVIQSPPPGYAPSGQAERNVALAKGTGFEFAFGNVRSEDAASHGEADEPSPGSGMDGGTGDGSMLSRVLTSVARVAGVLVLILAVAIAVLFILSRRARY